MEKRRRTQSCSIPINVHPAAIHLASNDPTAATESTHADVNGTAKSGNDVCFGKTLVKRVTQKSHRSVSFHLSFTARSVRLKGM